VRALPPARAPWPAAAASLGAVLPTGAGLVAALAGASVVAWVAFSLAVVLGALARLGRGGGVLDWLVVPALRVVEYGTLLGVALLLPAGQRWTVFALLAAVVHHHYEQVYRPRYTGRDVPDGLVVALGGWEGRTAVALIASVTGWTALIVAMAAWSACLSVGGSVWFWARADRTPGTTETNDEEDA
jgi:hypothetical protein